ncbi:MAG: diadenylate cyclase CdaA [Salinivirgaceae bacterium]|nr:diadenylate cyclase CdaA [Salinivirgaceae bacterium]
MDYIFETFKFTDLIDILLVAFILYQIYRMVKGTLAINIFIGMLVLYVGWLLVSLLNLTLVSTILGAVISVGVIVFVVLFQQELRQFFILLGKHDFVKRYFSIFNKYINNSDVTVSSNSLRDICRACRNMAQTKTGALIIFTTHGELPTYVQSGDTLNADISHRLIESIFFKNSPMHDGAMIIIGDQIRAARCVLPINESLSLPAHLGLRHRAALSMSIETNVIAIVVSEETGSISVAQDGQLRYDLSSEELFAVLHNEFIKKELSGDKKTNEQ